MMGFKYPVITVTLYRADGSVAEHHVHQCNRYNQHYDRPPQGSNARNRLKAKRQQIRKCKGQTR